MVAHRKKLAALGVLIAIGLLAFFGWRPMLVARFTPPDVFNSEQIPEVLDYLSSKNWAAHPSRKSAALVVPDGLNGLATASSGEAAVFYVHPTTYFAGKDWNWSPDSQTYAQQGIEHTLATQASAFNECCVVYAPYYRQAHISAFGAGTEASLQALDLAYRDVALAFDHFLKEIGSDTPFFLAGHSQGSAHLQRLISEKINGLPVQERMVAAYVIGYWLPADISTRSFPEVPLCESAASTGCIVTWDTYDRGAESLPFFSVPHWFINGWGRLEEVATACVNPLSWSTSADYVESQQNLGAIETKPAGGLLDIILNRNPGVTYASLGASLPEATSAQCQVTGKLFADTQTNNEFERSGHGESGSYHAFDWNLFYFNVRQNVMVRLAAHGESRAGI